MSFTQLPPLSLYVHTPWCVQKCPYCDFNSHQLKQSIPEEDYIDRLLFDLEQELPSVWGRQLYSIFIGGGTPSLFSPQSIDRLLCGIRALLPFNADMEITMEANPGTVDAENFSGFFDAGVNRLSLGVQSFDDQKLKALGRIHDGQQAEKALTIARAAGFKNINLDLMYALPQQSMAQAMADLEHAIALQPQHLSWYQLTLEPNTPFHHRPPSVPDLDLTADIGESGLEILAQNDYTQYEISAFSQAENSPSQHNINYWQFGDYLGIGAGAHQKISRADRQTITRKSKRRNPKDYLNPELAPTDQQRVLTQDSLPLEFMMNALRLRSGFERELFFANTGILITQIETALTKAEQQGLLQRHGNRIKTSDKGYRFLNELLDCFMPENFPELADSQKIITRQID